MKRRALKADSLGMTVQSHGEPPTHLTFAALESLGLPHASTTRHCPDIAPPADLVMPFGPEAQTLFRHQGLDLSRTVYLRQVHGKIVQKVEGDSSGFVGQGDILLTSTPGLPLSIFTADCLAVILLDPVAPRLALAHVGWRGTVQSAVIAAVDAMTNEGTRPRDLLVTISPSIGPCCYEVDPLVIDPLRQAFPAEWERWGTPNGEGKWMLDLWTANHDQLVSTGCRSEQIHNARLCTACSVDRFFSYRKEGSLGRQVTVAALSRSQIPS
jgi:YfiH family protein